MNSANNNQQNYDDRYKLQNNQQTNKRHPVITTLYIAVGISAIVALVWIIWAYTVYRYSTERISGKLLNKYKKTAAGKNVDSSTQYITVDNVTMNKAKTMASARMSILDKKNNSVVSSETFSAIVELQCSPINVSCVSL